MAITRAQQAKQMLQDGGRIGLKAGAQFDTSLGGGAISPGTDISGQFRGGNGGENKPPIVVPKTLKKGLDLGGEVLFLKNLIDLNPVGVMKNIGSKLILDRLTDVSAMDIKRKNQLKNVDYETAKDIGMINPTMTKEEFEGVKSGEITEPTGQFAADGGRIGAMGGGIMGGLADGQMDEMGRQMYGLGKLVKEVTRTVKKIAKSPIGKAALLYTGLGGLGNLASGANFFSNFASPTAFLNKANLANIFSRQGLGNIASRIGLGTMKSVKNPITDTVMRKFTPNMLGKILTSPEGIITATSLLPLLGLGTGDETEEEAKKLIADNTGLNFDELRPQGPLRLAADGGLMRLGYQEGGDAEPVAKKTMPLIDMDGKEKDYRETGGFVDMGRMEKADDVPARLSKNEFVFTADAVRNAGDGSVDKGAEVMYNMMKNLEAGGDVSEESQGMDGARRMFQTSQRLEEVL